MNRDNRHRREEILGKYLSAWLDDLRAGRSPEVDQEALAELSDSEVLELFATARFTKALHFPSEPIQGQSGTIRSRLGQIVFDTREKQLLNGRVIVQFSKDFGQCLRTARERLGLSMDILSSYCEVPEQLLRDVEEAKRSPIRIPAAKMANLLIRLCIGLDESVELIGASAELWAREIFPRTQNQLGRISKGKTARERRDLLEGAGLEDVDASLERELVRIRTYRAVLRQELQGTTRGPF